MKLFNLINFILKYQKLVFVCLALSSCSFKKVDHSPHEAAVKTELAGVGSADGDESRANKAKTSEEQKSLTEIYNAILQAQSADALKLQMAALEQHYLNKEKLATSVSRNGKTTLNAVSYYNYSYLKLFDLLTASSDKKALIAQYEKILLGNCISDKNTCAVLGLLDSDSRTIKVLTTMVADLDADLNYDCTSECVATLTRYYGLLELAFATSHGKNDTVDFLYLKHAAQYAKLMKSKMDESASNQKIDMSEKIRIHGRTFEIIMQRTNLDESRPELIAFLNSFQPWKFSLHSGNEFNFSANKLFALSAKYLLYQKGTKQLNPEFLMELKKSQEAVDKMGLSFTKALKEVLNMNPTAKGIFQNFDVDTTKVDQPKFLNEYFFIIDRLYRRHIGTEEAAQFWENSGQDTDQLAQALTYYLKVEYVKRLLFTNDYIVRILKKKDVASHLIFQEAVQDAQPLTRDWADMLSQFFGVYNFVKDKVSVVGANGINAKQSEILIAKNLLEQLKKNAQYISGSPNSVLLAYIMLEKDSKLEFGSWFGRKITVDPASVMANLLSGEMANTWFIYGGEAGVLNRIEMIWAVHYLINNGILDAFALVKNQNDTESITLRNIFKRGFYKTLQDLTNSLSVTVETLGSSTENNSESFLQACDQSNLVDNTDKVLIPLNELSNYALYGNSDTGLVKTAFSYYIKGGGFTQFANLQNSFETVFIQLKAFNEVVKFNLTEKNKLLPADSDQRSKNVELVNEFDGMIKNIENKSREISISANEKQKRISDCMNSMTKKEITRQTELFNKEIQHLRLVYKAAKDGGGLVSTEALKKVTFAGPHELVTAEGYRYTKHDLLLRMAHYSETLTPAVEPTAIDQGTLSNLTAKTYNVPLKNPSTGLLFEENEFVSQGLMLLNSDNNDALNWLKSTYDINPWFNKIKALISLYRFGFSVQGKTEKNLNASEILNEIVNLTEVISISEQEKVWLKLMKRNQKVIKSDLVGFLFNGYDSDFIGLYDKFFDETVDIENGLEQAKMFYTSTSAKTQFLFPWSDVMEKNVKKIYKTIFERSEDLTDDFVKTLSDFNKNEKLKNSRFVYAFDIKGDLTYSPMFIDNGTSILVKNTKLTNPKFVLDAFHEKTNNMFKDVP